MQIDHQKSNLANPSANAFELEVKFLASGILAKGEFNIKTVAKIEWTKIEWNV